MYYARLTQIKTNDIGTMDPGRGKIICETAATGKFIINDINWKSAVAPNAETFTAYLVEGELKIVEPLGSRFLDYLRFAAIDLGIINHLDARYLLEIEFISQETIDQPAIKYIWPIMFISTEGHINEKGSEYTIKFVHCAQHAMNSQVQPIKETATVNDVETLGKYFQGLATVLERQEFVYAKAGQKAGKGTPWPGGDHPAASDNFHDEYYFVVDPRMENWTFTTKGKADAIKKGGWFGLSTSKFNIEARAGTTLNAQITKVLSSTNEADSLYTENYNATGQGQKANSGNTSPDRLKEIMGKIYNFVRVETYTVYKSYDYIRGRYACKHVFFLWLALEPKMYQYPDELDVLSLPENRKLVLNKLKAYIQEGLLSKWYYFSYTGLNTEVLKLDIELNQAYYLPSFPVIWADRGKTGLGEINPWVNSNKRLSPFAVSDNMIVLNSRIQQLEQELRQIKSQKQDSGTALRIAAKEKALSEATAARDAKTSASNGTTSTAGATSREALLAALSGLYIEDIDYREGLKTSLELAENYPSLRPMMAPDGFISLADNPRAEAERIMDKIFNVALQAKDLLNLDMEVRGDPYWFGPPNLGFAGKKALMEIEMPPAMKDKIVNKLTEIDPTFPDRGYNWGESIDNHANYYKGGNLVYLHVQLPNTDSTADNQNMTFDINDSVIGIYQILFVESYFRDGRFTQRIKGVRDLTIPSQFIPRSNVNEVTASGSPTDTTWETFVKSSLESDRRAVDDMREHRIQANTERMEQQVGLGVGALTGEQGMGAAGRAPSKMATGLDEDIATAKTRYDLARSKADLPTVKNPVENAEQLVKDGYSKDQAYKMAADQWEKDKADYFGKLNQVTKDTYKGTNEQDITKYRPYDADAMSKVAGDGGLEDWKRGNTQRPGPWALNNPAGLGQDVKTGRYYQYPTLEDGLRAQHEYYNYGIGVPVGSTSAGGTKLPDRYLLPTEQTTYDHSILTGQYKATGTQPVTYNTQQQVDYIKQQNNPRLASGGKR
jgi:hypothetical protein